MNFQAFRSAARLYFADEATDEAAIIEKCATPSPLLLIQSLVKSALASLISLGRPSSTLGSPRVNASATTSFHLPCQPKNALAGLRVQGSIQIRPQQATSDSAN
jgi:hypothetical protein